MTKGDVAVQLTLALIEKGQYYVSGSSNKDISEAIVELYNGISKNIDVRGREE